MIVTDENKSYDSRRDTMRHISDVQDLLTGVIYELRRRSQHHDASKLESPEKAVLDEMTPLLKGCTYGSDEYKAMLGRMKPALDHHYAANRHHPEHFGADGIRGMNLIDVVEMFCDWNAAVKRHDDGDIQKSLLINQKRFGFSDDLLRIFQNTVEVL